MGRARRKVSGQTGATLVFALVVFLILTIFCQTMMSAFLSAAETSARLRNVEKVSASVVSAARLIQDSLINDGAEMIFRTENQRWTCPDNALVENVLIAALNNESASSMEFIVSVRNPDKPDVETAFEAVRLSVTAENFTEEALEQYEIDGDPYYLPTFTIQFTHPADGVSVDYAMTMRVMACKVNALNNPDGGALIGYAVTFAKDGDLNIRISPGVSS